MAQEAQNDGLKAIVGDKLIVKDDKGNHTETTFDELKDAKAVAIYFSAHWCPVCLYVHACQSSVSDVSVYSHAVDLHQY